MDEEWQDLIDPIEITAVAGLFDGDNREPLSRSLYNHPAVAVRSEARLSWDVPWSWYPRNLPHWGLGLPGERPRLWFAGRPRGLEWDTFTEMVVALSRGRRIVSPLVQEALGRQKESISLAVLTVPT